MLNLHPCNDDVICDLATALAHMSKLEQLSVFTTNITDRGWRAMESSLCDISSIGAIYNLNHTLRMLCNVCLSPNDTLGYLLEINYNNNKVEVARTKILQFHATIRPTFDGLAMAVLPIAISWLGIDRHGFSTLYHLLEGMPSLYTHTEH